MSAAVLRGRESTVRGQQSPFPVGSSAGERLRMFVTYLRRELRRRRRQALVITLGLAVGIGLVITVNAASAGVQKAQSTVLESLYGVGTDMAVTQPREPSQQGERPSFRFDANSQDEQIQDRVVVSDNATGIDASRIDEIESQDHVADAVGALALTDMTVNGKFMRPDPGTTPQPGKQKTQNENVNPEVSVDSYSISGVDVTDTTLGPLSSVAVSEGRGFTHEDAAVALVDAAFAAEKSLKVGSTLTIVGTKFTVVGIVNTVTGTTTTDVYVPLQQAQTLANMKDQVSVIYVKATSSSDISAAKSEIEAVLPDATVTTSSDLADKVTGSLSSAAGLATNLGTWLSIAVLAAAFLMAILFTISAVSRRIREFGTLKALGWRSRRIVAQVMGEALVQGILGGIIGIGLGYLGAFLVGKFAPALTATVGGSESGNGAGRRLAEATTQVVDVTLTAPVTLASLGLAVALALTGGLLAGTFGGWRASRMRPADALRRLE